MIKMVKINPSSICTKYEQSIDSWLLPIPTIENGQYKLRCFMSENKNKKKADRTWRVQIPYITDANDNAKMTYQRIFIRKKQ